jgi:hypothetical protein
LGLLSEEYLVQRLGLFSYWRARPVPEAELKRLAATLDNTQQKFAQPELLLLRNTTPAE